MILLVDFLHVVRLSCTFVHVMMSLTCFSMYCREWYTNGDYLVLLVTFFIILPLSLLRNLGKQLVRVAQPDAFLQKVCSCVQ